MGEARRAYSRAIIVRAFRLWAVGRETIPETDDRLLVETIKLSVTPQGIVACVTLFSLIEAELGRSLEAGCLCSQRLSNDERALLGVLDAAERFGPARTARDAQRGLPARLHWAAMEVCERLGMGSTVNDGAQRYSPHARQAGEQRVAF